MLEISRSTVFRDILRKASLRHCIPPGCDVDPVSKPGTPGILIRHLLISQKLIQCLLSARGGMESKLPEELWPIGEGKQLDKLVIVKCEKHQRDELSGCTQRRY